ncbi:MAG TPA: glucose-6-phosphate dehydrogenase, partial [Micromonosporaceae bacterium]|nr:glucose-6-phosphate dehydrogenase [Micromonosporaceae bacterium]
MTDAAVIEPHYLDDRSAPPATLVIFGASGDLTRRKLLPAVESLARHNRLPAEFALVGVARTAMSDEQFIDKALGGRELPGLNGA